jgi:hypothetical protein
MSRPGHAAAGLAPGHAATHLAVFREDERLDVQRFFDPARSGRARERLADPRMTNARIAELVGCTSGTAFIHPNAFDGM